MQVEGYLLERLRRKGPEAFQRVRNATLVQDLNQPDTLANTLEV